METIQRIKNKKEQTGLKKPKRWQCSYCPKKYVKISKWVFKHFEKCHPKKYPKMKNISRQKLIFEK